MAPILRRVVRRWGSERGAEFVEFALAFPLLLLVVLGIMDFGLMFQQYEVITNAAREGARLASLPAYQNSTDVAARVNQYITASFLSGGGTVGVTGPTTGTISVGGGKCVSTVTVQVTYPNQFLFVSGIMGYFGGSMGTKTLTGSSTMRTEIAAAGC